VPLFPLIVVMVLTHLTFVGSRVALSLYALKLNASPATVGVLMSLLAVIPMLMSVHTGRWTDRSGPAVPTFAALLMVTAGALVPWIVQSINGLHVASVLLGSGFMMGHIAINNAVGHASTAENRARNFGLLALGFSTSSVLGPVITGFAIDHLGHARAFALLAAFPALALVLWPMIRSTTREHHRQVAPPANAHVFDLLRIAPLRAVFIVSGLLSVGWDLFTFMVPLYGARLGLSASTIGLIMGSFGFATFVVRAAMPWIARTFSEWQALTGALAITTAVYILFPLVSLVPILLTLAFILGLGLGVGQPMVMSLIHTASPAGRAGEAVGVRTTVMNASHTFLPLGFGALGSALGMIPVFWAIAACMAGGIAFAGRRRGTVV
jgi:predicted MFS family arabinose efflux permease